MRIWYDCEFLEDGRTIDLISIGMVREDGAEYYAVNSEAPWQAITQNDWLVRNVVPSLPITDRTSLDAYLKLGQNTYPKPSLNYVGPDVTDTCVKPHRVIANEVRDFILAMPAPPQGTDRGGRWEPHPQLWAWYGAYDHVALCQLWGRMIDLPKGVPMFTCDLKQEAERLGNPRVPEQAEGEHNALADARHNREIAGFLAGLVS